MPIPPIRGGVKPVSIAQPEASAPLKPAAAPAPVAFTPGTPAAPAPHVEVATRAAPIGTSQLSSAASPLMRAIYEAAKPEAARGNVPVELFATERNAAATRPLLTGPQIFSEYRSMIAKATREVNIQAFVWEPGSEASNQVLEGLKELAANRKATNPDGPPVEVRLLIDRMKLVRNPWYGELKKQLEDLHLDPKLVHVETATFDRTVKGNLHSKTITVDGQAAAVTGANLEFCHDSKEPWFDAGFRVDGDVATALRADFANAWNGRDHVTKMKDLPLAPAASVPQGPPVPMLVTTRKTDFLFTNRVDNPQDQAFRAAFANAKERIRIQTPNLNDDLVKAEVLAAVKRGVTVQVIVSKGFNEKPENLPGIGGGNEKNMKALRAELLKSLPPDVVDARFQVRWYSHDGQEPVVGNGPHASHAKYTSIDGQVVIVGSANMDTAAFNVSRETNVVIDSAATTKDWDSQLFEPNFARSIPFTG